MHVARDLDSRSLSEINKPPCDMKTSSSNTFLGCLIILLITLPFIVIGGFGAYFLFLRYLAWGVKVRQESLRQRRGRWNSWSLD